LAFDADPMTDNQTDDHSHTRTLLTAFTTIYYTVSTLLLL